MNKEQVQQIINVLGGVRQRPGLYMRQNQASGFLDGFRLALEMLSAMGVPTSFYKEALAERGWEWSLAAPLAEMQQRGLTEEEKVEELLTIEIEAWKKVLAQIEQPENGQ
ncbi:MAG: hypothetical protein HY866_01925 [Chloroflexi bacterium]|nr:hypothetical protein [Chloroflexota bacterium]